MPAVTHEGVKAKLSIELDVEVVAFTLTIVGNDSASPLPTALVAFATKLIEVPVVEETTPMVWAVLTS